MDKLTWYDNDGRIMCRRGYEVALARLASYEATGLTPEQVVNAKTIIESAFADDTSKAERIRKLMAADDEGRVVMLPPCKYGDTLYCLENGKIYPKTITLIAFYLQDTLRTIIISAKNYRGETNGFLASELGKTMFLSLEEAELWRNRKMSKPKKLGMPAAYTSNARADFLRRPKAAERRKWTVASDDRLERMEQKRMEREKEAVRSNE